MLPESWCFHPVLLALILERISRNLRVRLRWNSFNRTGQPLKSGDTILIYSISLFCLCIWCRDIDSFSSTESSLSAGKLLLCEWGQKETFHYVDLDHFGLLPQSPSWALWARLFTSPSVNFSTSFSGLHVSRKSRHCRRAWAIQSEKGYFPQHAAESISVVILLILDTCRLTPH